MSKRTAALTVAAALAVAAAGCGGSSSNGSSTGPNPNKAEVSPPGDIPDNQAFVRYRPKSGGYSVEVPEGWARTSSGGAVFFTDKLNSVRVEYAPASAAPTLSQARASAGALKRSAKGFQLQNVSTVSRNAGRAVRVDYLLDSGPDPVTGKVRKEAVERYIFFHAGKVVTLTLSGPKGADNVDPWRHVTDSLRWG